MNAKNRPKTDIFDVILKNKNGANSNTRFDSEKHWSLISLLVLINNKA